MKGTKYDVTDEVKRPLDKMYFVVFGLIFGVFLSSAGGTMAYLAWTLEAQEGFTSLAEAYHIPTRIMSIVLTGIGIFLLLGALLILLVSRCDCNKPPPISKSATLEMPAVPQVYTISGENMRL